MKQVKKERLKSKGWKLGTVSDFLDLTPEEAILVEIKLNLGKSLKERQQKLIIQHEQKNSLFSHSSENN